MALSPGRYDTIEISAKIAGPFEPIQLVDRALDTRRDVEMAHVRLRSGARVPAAAGSLAHRLTEQYCLADAPGKGCG